MVVPALAAAIVLSLGVVNVAIARRGRTAPARPAADVAVDEAWRRDGTDERARAR